jgi:hypothetical protein
MNMNGVHQLLIFSSIAHLIIYAFIFAIVIAGWRRTRHTGFLVLIAWSSLTAAAVVSQALWQPVMAPLLSKLFGTTFDTQHLSIAITLTGGIATSTLLCVGLGMLVFAKPRSQ